MQGERIFGDFFARTLRAVEVAIEAREGFAVRIGIESAARALEPPQRQALIFVEQGHARASRQQQREIPAATATETLLRSALEQIRQNRTTLRQRLLQTLGQFASLARTDMADLATRAAREFTQQIALAIDVFFVDRIVEQNVMAARAKTSLVIGQGNQQAFELCRSIAGTNEDRPQRRLHTWRDVRKLGNEIFFRDHQTTLDEAFEYALHTFALIAEIRNRGENARDVFVQRAEFAALIHRLQNLEGHDMRLTIALGHEHTFAGRQRGNKTIHGGIQRCIRIGPHRGGCAERNRTIIDLIIHVLFHEICMA